MRPRHPIIAALAMSLAFTTVPAVAQAPPDPPRPARQSSNTPPPESRRTMPPPRINTPASGRESHSRLRFMEPDQPPRADHDRRKAFQRMSPAERRRVLRAYRRYKSLPSERRKALREQWHRERAERPRSPARTPNPAATRHARDDDD